MNNPLYTQNCLFVNDVEKVRIMIRKAKRIRSFYLDELLRVGLPLCIIFNSSLFVVKRIEYFDLEQKMIFYETLNDPDHYVMLTGDGFGYANVSNRRFH